MLHRAGPHLPIKLSRPPRHRLALGAATALALVLLLVGLPGHGAPRAAAGSRKAVRPVVAAVGRSARERRQTGWADVAVTPSGGMPLPQSFLGISTEYWALPLFDGNRALLERLLSQLRVPGGGPLVIRVGGDSADHSFWDPRAERAPRWVYALNSRWVRRAAALVRDLGARVILDLNLITDTPLTAAEWARAALARFPRRSIIGLEIGNEPDLYARRFWMAASEHRWLQSPAVPPEVTAAGYGQAFESYADVLGQVAPGVPLLGPALGHPIVDANWIARLLTEPHSGLRVVSGHWYPYSGCVPVSSPSYPTVGRLLAGNDISRVVRGLAPVIQMAHRAGLSFRLTELNSVTCGGLPGVSKTFATALWAPEALFALARAGVDGVNLHMRAHAVNAPFVIVRDSLQPRPLLYGLLLFARCLGPQAHLLDVGVRQAPSTRLDAWAVRAGPRLVHVLLINTGPRGTRVMLRLPDAGPATVERLLAPGPAAMSSVTLGGQRLGPDGRWWGRAAHELAHRVGDGYELSIPRYSAALVSASLLPSPRHGSRVAGRVHPRRRERRTLAERAPGGGDRGRGASRRAPAPTA